MRIIFEREIGAFNITIADWINSDRSSGRIELTEAGVKAFASSFDELMTKVTFNEECWCANRDENEVTFVSIMKISHCSFT